MKKLIAGLIIVLLLGGILGFAPLAYADSGGGAGSNGIPTPPSSGRTDGGGASPAGGIPQPPPAGR